MDWLLEFHPLKTLFLTDFSSYVIRVLRVFLWVLFFCPEGAEPIFSGQKKERPHLGRIRLSFEEKLLPSRVR